MKRRRGEVSLFEILRQPEAAPVAPTAPRAAESEALPGAQPPEGAGTRERAHGSTTPAPEAAPRPRLDVTPPSRAARRLPELPPELSSAPPVVEAVKPQPAGDPWWQQPVPLRPTILALAGVGVLLSWWIVFQMGVGSAERAQERAELFSGEDAPQWPIIHGPPSTDPEVRNILGADGQPASPVPIILPDGSQRLWVVMVASGLKNAASVSDLMDHVDVHMGDGEAHVTQFKSGFAVFTGPYDDQEEAKEASQRVRRKVPYSNSLKVDFQKSYIQELEFTPQELRGLGRG